MRGVAPVWLVRVTAVVGVAALAGGFYLDGESFTGHVLSAIAELVASVFVAYLVIERIVEANRSRRWQQVSAGTLATLDGALLRAAQSLYLMLPAPRPPGADPLAMDSAGKLPEALVAIAGAFRSDQNARQIAAKAPASFASIQPQMTLIRSVVLPRMLLIGGEPALIETVVDLEQAVEAFDQDVWLNERFGLPDGEFMIDLARLADSLARTATASRSLNETPAAQVPGGNSSNASPTVSTIDF